MSTWGDCIKLKKVEDKYTLLSICNNVRIRNKTSMMFDNGVEVIKFNDKLDEVQAIKLINNHLLAIVVGKNAYRCQLLQQPEGPSYFILIKINDKDNTLTEVYRKKLSNILPKFEYAKIIYDVNVPSKLLIITEKLASHVMISFNMDDLQFSSSLVLKKTECFAWDNIFYCYNNILKDLIIFVDAENFMVNIIRETLDGSKLYIYKNTFLKMPSEICSINNVSCCNNRRNEIILSFNAGVYIKKDHESDTVLMYDVLKDQLHTKLCDIDGGEINSEVLFFFNQTGEEIFMAEENEELDEYSLSVYVYKSKVQHLKTLCQIVMMDRYSNEQLQHMKLPKYIFKK